MTVLPELSVALVQAELIWENPEANRNYFSKLIKNIDATTDLIVLPEMFTTGFTMNPDKVFETMDGPTIKWMQDMAAQKQAAITGSIVIKDNDKFFNRLLFVHPSGAVDYYDKRHTFTLAGEHKVYAAGTEKKIVNYKGWTICTQICYDLRFPVWSRNVEDYDVLLYVANWPKQRIMAWDTLLKARAIENMCYCLGVNRVGSDQNNIQYSGHSAAYDVLGEQLVFSTASEVLYTTLNKSEIKNNRERFQFLADRDTFTLVI